MEIRAALHISPTIIAAGEDACGSLELRFSDFAAILL